MSRRTRRTALGLGVGAVVALGLLGGLVATGTLGPRGGSSALPAPHFVDGGSAAGIDHV